MIEPGTTTRADVFAWFGPPHSIFKEHAAILSGESVGYYSYFHERALTSVDDAHYGMLYRFGEASARSVSSTFAIFRGGRE
jgi:hypothetical protein